MATRPQASRAVRRDDDRVTPVQLLGAIDVGPGRVGLQHEANAGLQYALRHAICAGRGGRDEWHVVAQALAVERLSRMELPVPCRPDRVLHVSERGAGPQDLPRALPG